MYSVIRHEGRLILPEPMRAEGERYAPFERQLIVRILNKFSGESTLFNELRAHRPLDIPVQGEEFPEVHAVSDCVFCSPLLYTPSDEFGRVEGVHTLTAANLAKYDSLHALVIFREHNPFVIEEEKIRDMLSVAHRWTLQAHAYDPSARFPFLVWNCLWRAGASIVHGHAQVLLAIEPYRAVREWLRIQQEYQQRYNRDYSEDMLHLYRSLGLAIDRGGGKILSCLTPIKEKEVVIFSSNRADLSPLIAEVLSAYRRLGVQSFNLALLEPPLGSKGVLMVRIVDRGNLSSRSSDIGGMELYGGTSVVSSDPFRLIEALEEFRH